MNNLNTDFFLPFSKKNYFFKSDKCSKAKLLNGIKRSHKVCIFYFVNIKILISCILLVHCGRKKMTSVNTEVYDTEIWEFFSNCNAVSHKCDETCDSQALD